MKIMAMLGAFLAQIFKAILEVGKRPRKVNPLGYDKELEEDHKKHIEDILNDADEKASG